ncbi:hypothetical protein FC62_GL001551 [Amylolactobacillus amylotrophicus DSM 20534]|uniref:DUF1211 domain-containing protein n=2 Tax=Amylolactobacillus TaxID=2767876 RepID=A0A0R1YG63_9LACO|nr:hypothetical protein FC62_GL001551 [Amylolactobacillus amylotrophicus DSM 20534]KRM41496.1 hypothetical protein FD40_GL001334 [Amylolactobacillus amylophilus DSM 20533 = JCM 1125]GED80630.1 hypothetical protein LAM01_11030 [Amylolactobacillus amylophilus]
MEKLKERMDFFSDAVMAIIITIMVLELTLPTSNTAAAYLQFGKSIGRPICSKHWPSFSKMSTRNNNGE